jgi:hypothetical protein
MLVLQKLRGIQANRNKQKSSSQDRPSSTAYNKQQRLTNLNVTKFLVENNIKTETELFAHAKIKEAGKKDLASFCLNRFSKSLQDLITNTTWKMEGASAELKKEVSRIDVVQAAMCTGVSRFVVGVCNSGARPEQCETSRICVNF